MNDNSRGNITSEQPHSMLCWHGSHTDEIWSSKDLCRPEAAQRDCAVGDTKVQAQLVGATVFTKLDANSIFWQIPLLPESRLLTYLYGRFCFNKLPFGISGAPEIFQKIYNSILEGLVGSTSLIVDTLVFGQDQLEHDRRLRNVLKKLEPLIIERSV